MIVAAVIVVLVIALDQLGNSASSARTERELITASDGVVQSTVTGTGSLEPVTEENVDFQTSGTLAHVDVRDGEYVQKGQLLATLDDTDPALTLNQAKATLAEARTTLSGDETTLDDESSSSATSNVVEESSEPENVSYTPTSTAPTSTAPTSTGPASTTPTQTPTTTLTATTPTTTATTPTQPTHTRTSSSSGTATQPTEPTETTTTGDSGATQAGSTSSSATPSGSSSTGSGSTGSSTAGSSSSSGSSNVTAATIDADKLQIDEDEQTVKADRQALDETRLRAPVSGTITSLESLTPGDSVSSGATSSAAASSDSTSTTGSTALGSSTGSTATSSTSSSSFAVIDSLKRLSLTVSFTEADINKIKVGQAAVVTLDALSNLELAGKVTDVSSIGTTTDDVTSYDATITLDQYDSRVKPGMSASAEVIIKQGHGVTVPSGAVTGSGALATVTVDVNGKQTTKKVIVGIRGDSRDLIVSGLSSGAELVETETLPAEGSSASTSSSSSSSATSGFGRRGLGGVGGGFPGGGFAGGAGAP